MFKTQRSVLNTEVSWGSTVHVHFVSLIAKIKLAKCFMLHSMAIKDP